MAEVIFAVGRRPTLSIYDAELLAHFLELSSAPAMGKFAAKIRDHIRSGKLVPVDREELTALVFLFGEAPDLLTAREFAAFRQLNDEVVAALATS